MLKEQQQLAMFILMVILVESIMVILVKPVLPMHQSFLKFEERMKNILYSNYIIASNCFHVIIKSDIFINLSQKVEILIIPMFSTK